MLREEQLWLSRNKDKSNLGVTFEEEIMEIASKGERIRVQLWFTKGVT